MKNICFKLEYDEIALNLPTVVPVGNDLRPGSRPSASPIPDEIIERL